MQRTNTGTVVSESGDAQFSDSGCGQVRSVTGWRCNGTSVPAVIITVTECRQEDNHLRQRRESCLLLRRNSLSRASRSRPCSRKWTISQCLMSVQVIRWKNGFLWRLQKLRQPDWRFILYLITLATSARSCGVIGPGIDVWSLSRSLASSKRRLMQHTLGRREDIEMKTTSGCETNDNDGGDDWMNEWMYLEEVAMFISTLMVQDHCIGTLKLKFANMKVWWEVAITIKTWNRWIDPAKCPSWGYTVNEGREI